MYQLSSVELRLNCLWDGPLKHIQFLWLLWHLLSSSSWGGEVKLARVGDGWMRPPQHCWTYSLGLNTLYAILLRPESHLQYNKIRTWSFYLWCGIFLDRGRQGWLPSSIVGEVRGKRILVSQRQVWRGREVVSSEVCWCIPWIQWIYYIQPCWV